MHQVVPSAVQHDAPVRRGMVLRRPGTAPNEAFGCVELR